MRGAAPVSIDAMRGAGWRGAVLLAAAAASGALAWWGARSGAWLAALPLIAVVIACAASLLRVPRGVLRFDGRLWSWRGSPVAVQAPIDLGGWMLLRLHGANTVWLPVGAADAGDAWHAFRAAVYCPAPSSTTADAHPTRDV
jgi:hypothetical protein